MARRPHHEARNLCPIGEQSKSICALLYLSVALLTYNSRSKLARERSQCIVSYDPKAFEEVDERCVASARGYRDLCTVHHAWSITKGGGEGAFCNRGEVRSKGLSEV